MMFCFSNMACGMMMMTCGTIAPKVARVSDFKFIYLYCQSYNVAPVLVQLCTLSFFLMFVPGSFMSLAILAKSGFKRSVSRNDEGSLIISLWYRL